MSRLLSILIIIAAVLGGVLFFRNINIIPSSYQEQVPLIPYEQWLDFEAEDHSFKVSVPIKPQHATNTHRDKKTNESVSYEIYASEVPDGTVYMVSMIHFSNKKTMGSPEELLESVVQEIMMSNDENKLLSTDRGTYLGNDSLDFRVENKTIKIDGKAFIKDNTLYVLSMAARKDTYNRNNFIYFVSTFKLPVK